MMVADTTHERLVAPVECGMDGAHLTHVLDAVCSVEANPWEILTDNRPAFTDKTMIIRANPQRIQRRPIDHDKPSPNAYVANFNGRLRDERLNAHRIISHDHANRVIEN
jgi:hypothetical protein